MNKKMTICILLLVVILSTSSVYAYDTSNAKPNNYLSINIDELQEPLQFTSDELTKLPVKAREFIKEDENTLVASISTIHVIKENEDKSGTIIGSGKLQFLSVHMIG